MKKFSKTTIFILFITSIIIPVLPAITVNAQTDPIVFRTSSAAGIVSGNWDPAVTDGYNILGTYFYAACEFPQSGWANYWGGLKGKTKEEEWWPVLATSLVTTWQPENYTNTLGFNNTGGRKAIEFTLREGVKFHDGSDWNATVFKWNIDRLYLISGNLTGNANGIFDQRNTANWWDPPSDWDRFYSGDKSIYPEAFNLSEYHDVWGHYYIGDPANPANKIQNPIPMIGSNVYTVYSQIPMVRWVEITESKQSGGKVKVHWNSWNSYGMEGGVWTPQISMQAYAEDYTDTGIYGYDNDDPGPDHFIGTGPWIYVEHDELADRGHMIKNENYWNKTALEAEGWFDVDRYEIVQFAPGDMGKEARNIALLSHEIDYAYDSMTMPIDYDAVMASTNINYYEDYVSEYQTQITLNCINETWWSGGVAKEFNSWGWEPYGKWNYSTSDLILGAYPGIDVSNITAWYGNELGKPAGIPRVMREALTYAFDHDTLINVDLNGRAVRGGGVVGVANIFYNASIPLPGYNLTYAREVLLEHDGTDDFSLTQPWWPINFSARLEARGIDEFSTDAEWQDIADHTSGNYDPILLLNFYWDDAHQDLADTFERAANNLGVALVQDADNKMPQGKIIWDTVGSYWSLNFDGESSIWSASAWPMDYHMPMTIPEGWIAANYGDPDRGTWRAGYYPTGGSPAYWPTWNFGFSYDTDIDTWIGYMYMSEPHRKKEYIGKIANKLQNEIFPMLYTYQTKGGEAMWANWDTFWVLDRDDRQAGFWGGISVHFLSYTPGTEYPQIPGVPLLITLTVSAVSMLGIIYIVMRKRKLR